MLPMAGPFLLHILINHPNLRERDAQKQSLYILIQLTTRCKQCPDKSELDCSILFALSILAFSQPVSCLWHPKTCTVDLTLQWCIHFWHQNLLTYCYCRWMKLPVYCWSISGAQMINSKTDLSFHEFVKRNTCWLDRRTGGSSFECLRLTLELDAK